jgi:hypothetical protein
MFSVLGRTCAGIWAPHSAKTIASLPEAEATVDTEIADLRDGKTNKIKVYPDAYSVVRNGERIRILGGGITVEVLVQSG